jgi:crotonobetainyl-CoA:carnitine CoA-transferase CaiB-like acyl-CoA transferase
MTGENRTVLEGYRVVEWGDGRASAYAGRLLCDHGADVVLLEAPGTRERALRSAPGPLADCEGQALASFLHGGKRSALFDPRDGEAVARAFDLLGSTDVFIVEQPLRLLDELQLSPEALAARFPRLVVIALSLGGFARPGRYLRHADLVAHAIGGTAYNTGGTVPSLADYPPIRPGGHQADYTTGLAAASAALIGLQLRRRTGRGELVDISSQAVMACYMRMGIVYHTCEAGDPMKLGHKSRLSPSGKVSTLWGLVPCKDGWFAFQASEQYQWDGLMRMMGDPEWAKAEKFQDPLDRVTYWDDIEPHFVAWTREHTKSEIFHAGQAQHVPVFPCHNVAELLDDPQQQARGFFVDLPANGSRLVRVPGAIVHLERTPWRHEARVPGVGEHTAELFGAVGGVQR